MGQRLELQALLETLAPNVYFQPPANTVMHYPCIRYERAKADAKHADNRLYNRTKQYQLTVIDRDPDSDIPDKVAQLPKCEHDRFYTADNLNHDVFNLFF